MCHIFFINSSVDGHLGCFHVLAIVNRACRALKPKKEPGVSNRDINGLMDWGAYMSEARSWSDTPPCVVDGGRTWWQSLLGGSGMREGEITSYRGN